MRSIDGEKLLSRLEQLGSTGRDSQGRLTRLAATAEDRAARDLLVSWAKCAGFDVHIDQIGNIFFSWMVAERGRRAKPIMIGSHIDTVVDAGILDGCYGVLAGLSVLEAIRESGVKISKPIVVAAFTNEEGVRFTPDLMGSLVYVGGLDVQEALNKVDIHGRRLGDELLAIGYLNGEDLPFGYPSRYVELHIEQGPVLHSAGKSIGVVEGITGISWWRAIVEGSANHAGTTPMNLRKDAGYAAMRIATDLIDFARRAGSKAVATVGSLHFERGAINVIPARVIFTVDLRCSDEAGLKELESALVDIADRVSSEFSVSVQKDPLARTHPSVMDEAITEQIEIAARKRGLSSLRLVSGAAHDAQMLSRVAPAAMIFVPSVGGISHSPAEHTPSNELVNGANILLDVVESLARQNV
ncbi:Zn-dependent hydrolase [Mesorhizobium sp. M1A.T.Ca.IN.004.03.1.1]|uniref:Zn-dependent hydrolase n=1 Tax=Mesorhizobium sp. M1A.T.Ca.IN.004.03.1.1 TaxID=2496795 RepID=UPI000FCA53DD|nr:Zn-dependent hydrolase [Mesorhizobium sp. M1A.T.Ca.IN.004.03.1.1]RUV41272.1 Zn-dependent hydrolase [Mesorhizobium sp. M1A.T.Ca.IN.004.03.1.1]